ncbi:MAG TPA: M81 family metallopeptidase [Alphaproteobacteria bacterium]|nr:M81 family metallopeptidase [Alphaproteobacteria bacterium]
MATIAVGGFQHETNTFAPTKADIPHFEHGGGWPPLSLGPALFDAVRGVNLALAGFIDAAHAAGHRCLPLVWANASPSAHVTRQAYEHVAGLILRRLDEIGPVDAVYLDLHGAMVAEHVDDGEGELLRRVRQAVGPRVPVVTSLDLHANVTRAMIEGAEGLVAYRTYPHVDMTDTGRRVLPLLEQILRRGETPARSWRQLPFLIPLNTQCTLIDPAKALYARLADLESKTGVTLSFTPGFPAADFADCGPAVFGYGFDRAAVARAVEELAAEVAAEEARFQPEILSPEDAVRRAMARSKPGGPPVVIADTQDNPGAGGNGDTVGLLDAMLKLDAQDAVLGLLVDAAAAKQAVEAGPAKTIEFSLGAKSGIPGHAPLVGPFTIERVESGQFQCTGPFYKGSRMRLGPMALLRRNGVRVVVASRKAQAADQAMFRHVGIEPAKQRVLGLKSSVHFRADFQPIAAEVLVCAAPGPMPVDPASLPWRKLRAGVRLRPNGPVFAG